MNSYVANCPLFLISDNKIPIIRAKEQPKLKNEQTNNATGTIDNKKTETNRKGLKPKVSYLCHRCKETFLTAAQFEKHYK